MLKPLEARTRFYLDMQARTPKDDLLGDLFTHERRPHELAAIYLAAWEWHGEAPVCVTALQRSAGVTALEMLSAQEFTGKHNDLGNGSTRSRLRVGPREIAVLGMVVSQTRDENGSARLGTLPISETARRELRRLSGGGVWAGCRRVPHKRPDPLTGVAESFAAVREWGR